MADARVPLNDVLYDPWPPGGSLLPGNQRHHPAALQRAEIPVAIKLLPRRQEQEEHGLAPVGNLLLVVLLLLLLIPLGDGRVSGWPA